MVEKLLSDVALEHTIPKHLQSKISPAERIQNRQPTRTAESSWFSFSNIRKRKILSILIVIGLDHKIVSTGLSIMIALSRNSTKLTVRNDVMDLLLTLFLLSCSVNEVPGRNDAVQNVFTFFSSFRNTPLMNPQRVGAGCTNPVTAPQTFPAKESIFFSYPGLSIWHRELCSPVETDSRENVKESEISM
ncbi:hypothetical protein BASA50_003945 [Batrachochytrium salamandrivorans]|uniref:Uncharacterized protein n=1 Tax=Batrachochytrium salamandrivorans TaxID=1357716 RepID=A0ABQ8FGS8_9FUNG|nr:hypothetical protein BASA62_007939 [Batrachochytrium salamandrivorans]KAH6580394.1 hypothetical protein BASA60_002868 [Batrachochytrium salamandrivorans]KAH6598062.1 hypothetical protein BASA50_003945 [Batrachochytrium salamandrivorans]KAH9272500.1 hypothetical protein BASA83_005309 [Batrachochytrium salamandrivorans]